MLTILKFINRITKDNDFTALLDAVPDALIIVDNSGDIQFINGRVEEYFGYSKEEIIGQSATFLVPEPVKNTHAAKCAAYRKAPKAVPIGGIHADLTARRKDGSEFPVDISLSPLIINEKLAVVTVVRDITARVESEKAIRQLTTPVLKVKEGLLVMPIIGFVDKKRAIQLTEKLLKSISQNQARTLVMDLTGIATLDFSVADHLIKAVEAAKLLGAEVIITGLSSDNAQTLVRLGIDVSRIKIANNLAAGIEAVGQRPAPLRRKTENGGYIGI